VTRDELMQALKLECDRLAGVSADSLALPVGSMPGWTLEKLLRHVASAHLWTVMVLDAGPSTEPFGLIGSVPKPPRGPECLPAYRQAADDMIGRLASADPDAAVATWTGPGHVDFWTRRQLHEVTVHRFDAADAIAAAGGPQPAAADPAAAGDGVLEWAELFVRSRLPGLGIPAALAGRTAHLHATDAAAEALLRFSSDAVEVSRDHAKADIALRGPAQELLLTLWRRRPLDTVEVFGDRSVAESLYDAARF